MNPEDAKMRIWEASRYTDAVNANLLAPALKKRVRTVSKRLGLPEGEVINRAVSAYLADVENVQNLYQELAAWDAATADSMRSEKF